MQTFAQFGFRVVPYFTTTQLEYEMLKTNLEKIGHAAEKMPDGIGAVILEDGKNWLTTCKKGPNVRIGIYNVERKKIISDITYGYPKISERKCQRYLYRIEEHIRSGRSMKHNIIEDAWQKAIQRDIVLKRDKEER